VHLCDLDRKDRHSQPRRPSASALTIVRLSAGSTKAIEAHTPSLCFPGSMTNQLNVRTASGSLARRPRDTLEIAEFEYEIGRGARDLNPGPHGPEPSWWRVLACPPGLPDAVHSHSGVVADVLRSASGADPKVAREWKRWQERHLAAVVAVARSLAKRRALRRDLDVASATYILYAIGGPDTFRQLVHERGWTSERYERWLAEAGRRLLLE